MVHKISRGLYPICGAGDTKEAISYYWKEITCIKCLNVGLKINTTPIKKIEIKRRKKELEKSK